MLSAPTLQQYEDLRAWATGKVVSCPPGLGVFLKYAAPQTVREVIVSESVARGARAFRTHRLQTL